MLSQGLGPRHRFSHSAAHTSYNSLPSMVRAGLLSLRCSSDMQRASMLWLMHQPSKRARGRCPHQAHVLARGGLRCRFSSRPLAARPLLPVCARPTCPQQLGTNRQPPSSPHPKPPEQLPSQRQLSPVQPTACRMRQTSFGRRIIAQRNTCSGHSRTL